MDSITGNSFYRTVHIYGIGNNFFYTRALPCTLWFFDRAKELDAKNKELLRILQSDNDKTALLNDLQEKLDEAKLTSGIIELAKNYGRYGYRRITALLKQKGWQVNHKRVERIWRKEESL